MSHHSTIRPKVVLTQWVHPQCLDYLSQHADLITNQSKTRLTDKQRLNYCKDADAMMAFMTDAVDHDFLSQCPQLKFIAGALKGYDNINPQACLDHQVWLTICPDLLTEATADLAIALLLGLSRHVIQSDRYIRDGGFLGWAPVFYGTGLRNREIGILGMGKVGQSIARKLLAFGPHLSYCDPGEITLDADLESQLSRRSFEELISRVDHLILAAPLNEDSYHQINPESLMLMKPGAHLVNIGRGSVVNEQAVAEALKEGQLAGYAADVFEFEDQSITEHPTGIHPDLLANTAQTLFTPHLGSAVTEVREAIAMSAAEQIVAWIQGRPPEHVIIEGRPWCADS